MRCPGVKLSVPAEVMQLAKSQKLRLVLLSGAIILHAPVLRSQVCDTIVSRTTLSDLSGAAINSVSIKTLPPVSLPSAARLLGNLHVTTRLDVIRHDLLFIADSTVDTVRIGESLRRLRHRPYIADAFIEGFRCASTPGVDLLVTTRDKWTTKPSLSVQSNSSLVGIQEDNLFGSGASVSFSAALREGRLGGAIGYQDFWLFHTTLSAKLRAALYPDGNDFRLRLRTAEESIRDKWRREIIVGQYQRDTRDNPVKAFQSFHRRNAILTVARRLHATPTRVDALLFGADVEKAALTVPDNAPVVGPRLVNRDYIGGKAGVSRRSAAFDTLTWLVDKQIIVDVPINAEWDGLAGLGKERISGRRALFLNGWAGRMWVPDGSHLLQLDFWGSGYRLEHRGNWDAGSLRAAFSSYRKTGRGVRAFHLAAEQLVNPDPDVRALANVDITSFTLPLRYRFAEAAVASSEQQSMHVRDLSRTFALDAAVFAASSYRWRSPVSQADRVGVSVLGAGLRLIPKTRGSGAIRLDVMYPVLRSPVIRQKPVFAISLAPWLEASRQREDPRLRR